MESYRKTKLSLLVSAALLSSSALAADEADKNQLITELSSLQYSVTDLSDNEVAKVHLRFMVGGHAAGLKDERLFRCRFPERPGALLHFLDNIGHWNISLFHYRNHGNSTGNVLCGFQVPKGDVEDLEASLSKTGYPMEIETGSQVYEFFLRA